MTDEPPDPERKWMCLRCMEAHDIVDGVVQCPARPLRLRGVELTTEQMLEAVKWANEHPIETSDG